MSEKRVKLKRKKGGKSGIGITLRDIGRYIERMLSRKRNPSSLVLHTSYVKYIYVFFTLSNMELPEILEYFFVHVFNNK